MFEGLICFCVTKGLCLREWEYIRLSRAINVILHGTKMGGKMVRLDSGDVCCRPPIVIFKQPKLSSTLILTDNFIYSMLIYLCN